jgi:lipopolysaccharide transport protein LptA
MPSSRSRTRSWLLGSALCGLAGPALAASAPRAAPPAPPHAKALFNAHGTYTFDAASSEIDYKSHTGAFQKITIQQGKITVVADRAHASGLGRPNGEWTLQGNVQVHAPPHGSLTSDQAVVQIDSSRIARVTVTGAPAQFRQQSTQGRITQGHANQIIYNVTAGTVRLSHQAWVAVGRDEFSGPSILYNINQERIQATSSGSGERVHITIAPQKSSHGAPPSGPSGTSPPAGRSL